MAGTVPQGMLSDGRVTNLQARRERGQRRERKSCCDEEGGSRGAGGRWGWVVRRPPHVRAGGLCERRVERALSTPQMGRNGKISVRVSGISRDDVGCSSSQRQRAAPRRKRPRGARSGTRTAASMMLSVTNTVAFMAAPRKSQGLLMVRLIRRTRSEAPNSSFRRATPIRMLPLELTERDLDPVSSKEHTILCCTQVQGGGRVRAQTSRHVVVQARSERSAAAR